MMQINKILPINFRAVQPHTDKVQTNEPKTADSDVSAKYLENLALLNTPKVQKVELNSDKQIPYKNNLKTMI